jgi:methylated-DNA-[protein]-cysteine S-methyltransferase
MSTKGERAVLGYCLVATACGPVGLAWSDVGILRAQLPGSDGEATRQLLRRGLQGAVETDPPDWLEATVTRLQRYFTGTPVDLSTSPLDLSGVPEFNRRLYEEMLKLRWGETVTYGELATRVGAAGASQSVGRAMGQNPVPIIIPCHRVLASGNRLGGFSAPGGTRTKLRMLEMEGVWVGAAPGQMAFAF